MRFKKLLRVNNAFAHSLILAVSIGILSNAWFIDRKGLATAITYCGI